MKVITKHIRKAIICDNIGSEIVKFKTEGGVLNISNLAYIENFDLWEQISLIKTPIQEIKDEDAVKVGKLCGIGNAKIFQKTTEGISIINSFDIELLISFDDLEIRVYEKKGVFTNILSNNTIHAYQYLKSKNYAMPYMDYSVNMLFKSKIYQKK